MLNPALRDRLEAIDVLKMTIAALQKQLGSDALVAELIVARAALDAARESLRAGPLDSGAPVVDAADARIRDASYRVDNVRRMFLASTD